VNVGVAVAVAVAVLVEETLVGRAGSSAGDSGNSPAHRFAEVAPTLQAVAEEDDSDMTPLSIHVDQSFRMLSLVCVVQ
jgi:hypothetical protein